MNYQKLSDDNLYQLLFTEEDRLPRAAVDEFVRRGESMTGRLGKLASTYFFWTKEDEDYWLPIHATFILGAIGTEASVLPLLKAIRHSAAYDCDWVGEVLASIFGKAGVNAMPGLMKIASDETSDWFVRATAIDCLASIAHSFPEAKEEVFGFIGAILTDKQEERDVKGSAANTLLNFQRSEYKEHLIQYAKEEEDLHRTDNNYPMDLSVNDIERLFKSDEKNTWHYTRDWLEFYSDENIAKRQKRWEEEDREDRELEMDILDQIAPSPVKVGRNSPCPCGSGKKYKKCCGLVH